MYLQVEFEWDPSKNRSNIVKHGIDFETAKLLFDDPHHLAFLDRVTDGEERWLAIGAISGIAVVVVVHTYRLRHGEEIIRMISARQASKNERKLYAETIR